MTTKVGSNDMEEKDPESNVGDTCEKENNSGGIEQCIASTENTSPESENPTSDSKSTVEEENTSPESENPTSNSKSTVEEENASPVNSAIYTTDDYNSNNDGEKTVDIVSTESTENWEESGAQKGATGTEERDTWSQPASEDREDTQEMGGNLQKGSTFEEENDEYQGKYTKGKGRSEETFEGGNRQRSYENQGCRPKNRPGIQRPYGGTGDERLTKERKNKNCKNGEKWEENPRENKEKTKKEKKNRSDRFRNDLPDDRDHYEYFWRSQSIYSQWYACTFEVDGTKYNCAEQYMMHQKAELMKDVESAEIILALDEPREMKQQGRYVKNFDQDLWNKSCKDIVMRGNMAKFSQNGKMKEILFSTYPKTLVEASPVDQIWGIGLAKDDRRAWNKQTWRGQNLLGEILTKVRDTLMDQGGILDPVKPPTEEASTKHDD